MSASHRFVLWFEDCRNGMVAQVGGKCASLGELINAGVRVPPGFAVTTAAYDHFMQGNTVLKNLDRMLDGIKTTNIEELEKVSKELRRQIEETEFSIELEDQIAEAYRTLSNRCGLPAVPVAVRSSATAEDLPEASFAGQQDTFLWIRGVDDMLDRVRRCMSSLFTARAIAYRMKTGFRHTEVSLSVGVQKMAISWVAGVMFTLNPANGDRSSIVIDANYGFGESVVSGEVTPDNFLINKISMEITKRNISEKEVCYTLDPETHSPKLIPVPEERRRVQSIIDDELIEVARMGAAIEKLYGRPVDVEWAIDKSLPHGGNVMILQARPETVWAEKEIKSVASKPDGSAMDYIVAAMMTGKKLY